MTRTALTPPDLITYPAWPPVIVLAVTIARPAGRINSGNGAGGRFYGDHVR
jgi:hypothetical protein